MQGAWWQQAVFYQIYPRSFADGNGDGIGDFVGMTARLDYLRDLGIDAIWLSPHYPSPFLDCGYDISDYTSVAPEYGSLADFTAFLRHDAGTGQTCLVVLNFLGAAQTVSFDLDDRQPRLRFSSQSREDQTLARDWLTLAPFEIFIAELT